MPYLAELASRSKATAAADDRQVSLVTTKNMTPLMPYIASMPSTLLPVGLIDESILILISQLLHAWLQHIFISEHRFIPGFYTIKQLCQITVGRSNKSCMS
jgi:hypothetical protein